MALTSTILTTTPADIFLSNGNTAITTMYLCNTGNITAYFNIYAVPAGTSAETTRLIYHKVPVTPSDTYVIESEKLILEHGDSLKANIVDPASLTAVGLSQTNWGTTNSVNGIVWASDRDEYLVVGDNGKVATSLTGESWEYRGGLISLGWPSGTHINAVSRMPIKRYVAVADDGRIGASIDGITWTNQNALSNTSWGSNNVNDITNNGSIFVAVGNNGLVATSLDGVQWTVQTQLISTPWSTSHIWSVIWTGVFFMIGGDGGKLATSPDGITWSYINNLALNPAWGASTRINAIAYSGTQASGYMVISADNNKIAISSNGAAWSYDSGMATAAAGSGTVGASAITFRPGYGFYVGSATGDIYYKDLTGVWTKINSLTLPPWNGSGIKDLLWNTERSEFIAVGYNARVATSNDGINWTYRSAGAAGVGFIPAVAVTVSSIGI